MRFICLCGMTRSSNLTFRYYKIVQLSQSLIMLTHSHLIPRNMHIENLHRQLGKQCWTQFL